jgi:glycosyltransferase involved in cell wall biosynthesis
MTVAAIARPRPFPTLLAGWLDRAVQRSLSAVIVPAAAVGAVLTKRRGFDPKQVRVLYPGVAAEPWTEPEPCERRSRRVELGISPDAQVVGLIANFTGLKGQDTLVEAAAALGSPFPKLEVVLVGDGPDRRNVEQLAKARGITDHVHFAGHRTDVADLLQMFDVFTLPTQVDAFPLVILEAMSRARPVIASGIGGIPEAVVEGETGLLVPPRDPDALAERLGDLLRAPDLAVQMGRAGYERFCKRFTLEHMLDEHQTLYRELLAPYTT